MTIGIELLRADKGGNPELVRESEKRRFRSGELVDAVIDLDKQWVTAKFNTDQKRKEIGKLQNTITERKKTSKGQDKCEDLLKEKEKLQAESAELDKFTEELIEKRDSTLGKIGNLVHDSVPISQDEDKDNRVDSLWGVPRSFEGIKYQTNGFRPHFELLDMIGAVTLALVKMCLVVEATSSLDQVYF